MNVSWMSTADKRIEAFNPMDQTLLDQKLQGPIHRRRSRRMTFALERIKQDIGANGFVARPNQLQNPTSQGGQPRATPFTLLFRPIQRVSHAAPMIVA